MNECWTKTRIVINDQQNGHQIKSVPDISISLS